MGGGGGGRRTGFGPKSGTDVRTKILNVAQDDRIKDFSRRVSNFLYLYLEFFDTESMCQHAVNKERL